MLRRLLATSGLLALLMGLLVITPVAAQEPAAVVEVGSNFYEPPSSTIAAGETVRWEWIGGFHNVRSSDGGFEGSGEAQTGGTFEVTFDEPGIYDYFCSIHSTAGGSSQNGTIVVEEGDVGPTPEPTEEPTDEPTAEPVDPDADPVDVDGDDPVETALSWSGLIPDGGATTALIGTAGSFADSLASGALQGAEDAPLLLTDGTSLDPRVVDELARLGTTDIIILGGVNAISQAVEDELAASATTLTRIAGESRLETSREVADALVPADGLIDTVIMARAFGEGTAGFADALGAGAAAAATGFPVILNPTEALNPDVAAWLTDRQVQTVHLAGGTAALSAEVEDALTAQGIAVVRLAGASRFGTAAALASLVPRFGELRATVVDGVSELSWASGFAAALSSEGGLLLTADGVVPGDTISTLFGVDDQTVVRCGPTVAPPLCDEARTAGAVDPLANAPIAAVMDGDQEVPPATTGASGSFFLYAAGDEGLCMSARLFEMSGPITVAHLHENTFGASGPPVVPFTTSPDEFGMRYGCVAGVDAGVLTGIFADPAAYYVNFHTELFPMGEIRGQLFTTGTAFAATLTGDQEVPDAGDPDTTGFALVYDTGVAGELCYVVDQNGLTPGATMAHIHRGAAGEAGPVEIPLVLGAGGDSFAHCDRGLDVALLDEIFTSPEAFYVNLHNDPFPAGAIRGQLVEFVAD